MSSNAVDSLFGLSRGRSGPAPGFGGHQSGGQQDLLFGLGGKTGGGLDGLGSGRLGLGGLGLGDRLYSDQKQNHLGQHLQDNGFASKDWQVNIKIPQMFSLLLVANNFLVNNICFVNQDGLRALLPNVNVSFGNHNNGQQQQQQGHFGLQNMHQQQQQQQPFSQQQDARQQLQQSTGWGSGLSNGLGNDWTMLDPAIVSGQLANNDVPGMNHLAAAPGRSDSPPNWITANLDQLTAGDFAGQSQNNLIPAFNGLGLGDRLRPGQQQQAGRLGAGWGGPPPASTATPPPGFSHHRQNLGQQQHYQPGFPVNKGSEAHKIGGEKLF